MNKKSYIIFISVMLFFIIGAGIAAPGVVFNNPEINILQELLSKGTNNGHVRNKIKGLDALIEEELRMQARQNMSKEEQDAVTREKVEGHKKRMEEIASYTPAPLPAQISQNPFQGIWEGNSVPAPFRADEFRVLNFLGGEIDGKAVGIFAGYRPENPLQGFIVVFDDINDSQGKFYPVPKATGPIRIISEKNGVLTLKSVTGEFEIYNQNTHPSKEASVPGGATYLFDTKARLFR